MRSDEAAFLDVAAGLAEQIARAAIWSDGRCNWVGALAIERRSRVATGHPAVAALGPDFYEGTSGVALFLAEAGARLDDAEIRATALGAIRLALDHADRLPSDVRDGFYGGPIGIAYAAARIAGLLEAEDVLTSARELLAVWGRDTTRSPSSDVMTGCAGAVAGLVALGGLVDEPWLVDAAVDLGVELIARADRGPEGWSWAAPGRRSMQNLCGYAHGAAGIGHALAELATVTGDARFRETAGRAFDYERSWLDTRSGAWADLRGVARRAGHDAPVPAADSWCNGAAGIALSRIRAAGLLGSAALRRDADIALAACERHLDELIVSVPDDFSLCHGAAGGADVLLHAPRGRMSLAAQLGARGIELHGGPQAPGFPCGTPVGATPALMLGSAGIGMFYLRLSDTGVPSPLLVRSSEA
jgi:lantibiotic biosynthesis protein